MSGSARWSDRRLVVWMGAVMLVLIAAVSILAPKTADDDPRPTTYNTGPEGAKAAYLTLDAIGRKSSRWERPIEELDQMPADRITVVLAAPAYLPKEKDEIAAVIKRFLERGGRVLTTGGTGALLLPGGGAEPPSVFQGGLCRTSPGNGPLAAAGAVEMRNAGKWAGNGARAEVAERCGQDAVVVRLKVGQGEAVWWSSASALSNAELKNEANVRLLLLSVGQDRAVVWDESLHEQLPGLWSAAKGLPIGWLIAQVAVIALLLVLSFSRRNGPLRAPVTVPRSSPVEFAESMGDLYRKARASTAATDAARRRILRTMTREAGVPQSAVDRGPQAIATALSERLGGDWSALATHLERTQHASTEDLTLREALALARALGEDSERIRAALRPRDRDGKMIRTERVA